jgi:hypothetical protein
VTDERWAQQIIEKELDCTVAIHDDNSQPHMYDLRIGAVEAPDVAIECVGAVDSDFTETWKRGPGRGPLHLKVKGNWTIGITWKTQIRTIERHIEPILQNLEEQDVSEVRVDHFLKRDDSGLHKELESLDIRYVSCFRMPGTGRVHMIPDGVTGFVDAAGSALPQWIEEFLCDPKQEDVLAKLRRTSAQERWVYVPVTFGGAPWPVWSYLMGELECLPTTEPNLPSPVTGIWVASTFGTHGVRWDSAGWRLFRVREDSK